MASQRLSILARVPFDLAIPCVPDLERLLSIKRICGMTFLRVTGDEGTVVQPPAYVKAAASRIAPLTASQSSG